MFVSIAEINVLHGTLVWILLKFLSVPALGLFMLSLICQVWKDSRCVPM